jgi:hypothetical protein
MVTRDEGDMSQTRFAARKEKRCVERLNRKILATAQVLSWLMRAQ